MDDMLASSSTDHDWGSALLEKTWLRCVEFLQDELPAQQFNTWIRPLAASGEEGRLRLLAPNRFIRDWVNDKFLGRIQELALELSPDRPVEVLLDVGTAPAPIAPARIERVVEKPKAPAAPARLSGERQVEVEGGIKHQGNLIENYTFTSFVEGKSNQLARAAAMQVAENPGESYNPLFLYGGVGLG
jgi:chromosomal replication initiator protein